MPGICRIGDVDDNSPDPHTMDDGSPNVFVNNLGVRRANDPDSNGDTVSSSCRVFVNGQPVVRIGDTDNNGNIMVTGSSDVFAGP